ncbi:TetR family transcriptional regulator [Streptomyces sp. CAU 1734]|uniref:TetR/AcrR family transcriptional regulator n=1 Tax=Streptomyces sp. CAU 1734 TaxID=3140360 RepID=UPI00325FE1A4
MTDPAPRPEPAAARPPGAGASRSATAPAAGRAELIADTALGLLAERGMRGLTHRAVDEAAGLPQGSTSNRFRTRQALLEAAVRRLAAREAALLSLEEWPGAARREGSGASGGAEWLVELVAGTLHTFLARPALLVARYELALEATRRPELRAIYDSAAAGFRGPLRELMAAAGSAEPERHALTLIAWCEGLLFSCAAGADHAARPGLAHLRAGCAELLRGMLGERAVRHEWGTLGGGTARTGEAATD